MTRLLVVILLTAACAGVSPRAQLVQTHQGIQTLLASVDDAERIVCFGSTTLPSDPTRCSTPAAQTAGLTDARHRAISRAFVKAFDAQIALGAAIAVWQYGQAMDVSLLESAVAEIDAQLAGMNIAIPALAPMFRRLVEWKAEIARFRLLFGGVS